MSPIANFSYLIEGRIAGSAHPGSGEHLARSLGTLREEGVGAILTLCERPLEAAMLEEFGMEGLHLPIPDFSAPSIEQRKGR